MTIPKQSLRRKEITTAAAKLFKKHSFDRTTVRMIAKKVGIKSGSLFHHFKDKEEILFAVIEQGLNGALNTLKKEIKKANSAEEQLQAVILGQLKALHGKDKDAHIVSISEWWALDDTSRQRLIIIRDKYEAYWQRIIDAAISDGLLNGEPRLQRLFVLGSLNWTIQWYKPNRGVKIEDTAKEFYRFITK